MRRGSWRRILEVGAPIAAARPIVRHLLFVVCLLVAPAAFAQDECESAMGDAEAHYRTAAFPDAISALAPCVRSFPAGSAEDAAAHRLLALAFLRNGDIDDARIVIVELFERNPGYEPDPVSDPPAYVSLVNLVRSEAGIQTDRPGGGAADPPRTWLRSPRSWLIIGGGLAVVSALVVLGVSSGGGGGSNTLPGPPTFP